MRTDILDRKEEILQWIEEGQSKAYICKQLGCKQETLNSYLKKMNIEYAGRQNHNKGKVSKAYMPALEYIEKGFVKSHILKQKLIRDGIKEQKCEICGVSEWQGVILPLELHHKDGNHFNNELSNLQILCPNCHSIQGNNSGANRGRYTQKKENVKQNKICPICLINSINSSSKMCTDCWYKSQRKAERPNRVELKNLIRTTPFTKIGEMFGVSDNSIRKWCKAENLPYKKTEINKISDEEWEKI